jgi:hypothetical protein
MKLKGHVAHLIRLLNERLPQDCEERQVAAVR